MSSVRVVRVFGRKGPSRIRVDRVREFCDYLFAEDLHKKRVESLANGVTGVLGAAIMTIHTIGQAYAAAAAIEADSGVKQIDRLLSNAGIRLESLLRHWVAFVIGARPKIVVALDWTARPTSDGAMPMATPSCVLTW